MTKHEIIAIFVVIVIGVLCALPIVNAQSTRTFVANAQVDSARQILQIVDFTTSRAEPYYSSNRKNPDTNQIRAMLITSIAVPSLKAAGPAAMSELVHGLYSNNTYVTNICATILVGYGARSVQPILDGCKYSTASSGTKVTTLFTTLVQIGPSARQSLQRAITEDIASQRWLAEAALNAIGPTSN